MNRYRVFGGVAKIGAGVVLELSGPQIKDRASSLELPEGYQLHAKDPTKEKPPVPKAGVVKTTAPVEFIVGEQIGMQDLPKYLVGIVEPLDAPASDADEMAAEVALLKQDPAEHSRREKSKRASAAQAKAAKAAKK